MNTEAIKIRKALIDHVRKSRGATISYSELINLSGTGLALPDDRILLSDLLTEIFIFEHSSDPRRPLLTIMVVHKQDGGHGKRFYDLAVQHGYEKNLNSNYEAVAIRMREVIDFWCDDGNYLRYL